MNIAPNPVMDVDLKLFITRVVFILPNFLSSRIVSPLTPLGYSSPSTTQISLTTE